MITMQSLLWAYFIILNGKKLSPSKQEIWTKQTKKQLEKSISQEWQVWFLDCLSKIINQILWTVIHFNPWILSKLLLLLKFCSIFGGTTQGIIEQFEITSTIIPELYDMKFNY